MCLCACVCVLDRKAPGVGVNTCVFDGGVALRRGAGGFLNANIPLRGSTHKHKQQN